MFYGAEALHAIHEAMTGTGAPMQVRWPIMGLLAVKDSKTAVGWALMTMLGLSDSQLKSVHEDLKALSMPCACS